MGDIYCQGSCLEITDYCFYQCLIIIYNLLF